MAGSSRDWSRVRRAELLRKPAATLPRPKRARLHSRTIKTGRYAGKTLAEVYDLNPRLVEWWAEQRDSGLAEEAWRLVRRKRAEVAR